MHADTQVATGLIDVLGNTVWPLNIGLGSLLLFLFPDGRLPSRRWRFVFWLDVAAIAAASLSTIVHPGPMEHVNGKGLVDNPLDIPGAKGCTRRVHSSPRVKRPRRRRMPVR
jgi:hypothetical protein